MQTLRKMFRTLWEEHRAPFMLILGLGVVLVWFTFSRHRMTTNPRSRIITVQRLVDGGTWAHKTPRDSTPFELSIDMVKIGESYYSSKPPNYPLLMYLEAKPLALLTGWNFFDKQVHFVRMLVLLNQGLPYLAMLFLALFIARWWTKDNLVLSLLILALSLAILPFGYAVVVNNHVPAAALLFGTFAIALGVVRGRLRHWAWGIPAGLMAGFAGSIEIPGLVLGGLLLMVILLKNPRMGLVAGLSFLVPLIISSWICYQLSGSPKPFYFQRDLYVYEGSEWLNPSEGRDSRLTVFLQAHFGHHGLFLMSPILVLGFWGLVRQANEWRNKESWPFLAMLLAFLVMVVLVVWRSFNYGGWTIGMRWYIYLMPILAFAGLPLLQKLAKRRSGLVLLGLLILVGCVANAQALWYEGFVRSWLELWWIDSFGGV